ncbi:MAG: ATP-binding protein, partial [Terracidiphilus sp.]
RTYIEMTGIARTGRMLRNRIYSRVFIGKGAFPLVPAPDELDVLSLFRPSSPQPEGQWWQSTERLQLLEKCEESLRQSGTSVVIAGERGIGKTSFAIQLLQRLSSTATKRVGYNLSKLSQSQRTACIWFNCSLFVRNDEDLALGLLSSEHPRLSLRALFPTEFKSLNPLEHPHGERSSLLYRNLFEALVRKINLDAKSDLIIFLDDFDFLREAEPIGSFIKTLEGVQFVIVDQTFGTSRSLFENRSLRRKLRRVEIAPLSQDDVELWLDSVERQSGNMLSFTRDFRSSVFSVSRGVPWMLQRLGWEATRRAVESRLMRSSESSIVIGSTALPSIVQGLVKNGAFPSEIEQLGSPNPVLAAVVKRITRLPQVDRRAFYRALEYSLSGDGDSPPRAVHPRQICDELRISMAQLFDFQIIVDVHAAARFLSSTGHEAKFYALKKKLSSINLSRHFPKRDPAKVGKSNVFTYFEILQVEGWRFRPDLDSYIAAAEASARSVR